MMPYTIKWFDGPGTHKTAFKVYHEGGLQVRASPEEIEVWKHVQDLEAKAKPMVGISDPKPEEVQTSAPQPAKSRR